MVIDIEANKKKIEEVKNEIQEVKAEKEPTIKISKALFHQMQQSYAFIVGNALNTIDRYDAILKDLNMINQRAIEMSQIITELSKLIYKEKDDLKALYRNTAAAINEQAQTQQQQGQQQQQQQPSPHPTPPPPSSPPQSPPPTT